MLFFQIFIIRTQIDKQVRELVQDQYDKAKKILEENMDKLLNTIDKLIKSVPVYRLKCNMDISAAETAYNGMTKN